MSITIPGNSTAKELVSTLDSLSGVVVGTNGVFRFVLGLPQYAPEFLKEIADLFSKIVCVPMVGAEALTAIFRDFLTVIQLPASLDKLRTLGRDHFTKQMTSCFKVVQSAINIFLVLPDKRSLINLASICKNIGVDWITKYNVILVKDVCGLIASIFSFMTYNMDEHRACNKRFIKSRDVAYLKELQSSIQESSDPDQQTAIKAKLTALKLHKIVKIDKANIWWQILACLGVVRHLQQTLTLDQRNVKIKDKADKTQSDLDKAKAKLASLEARDDLSASEVVEKEACKDTVKHLQEKQERQQIWENVDVSNLTPDNSKRLSEVISYKINKKVIHIDNASKDISKANINRLFEVANTAALALGYVAAGSGGLFVAGSAMTALGICKTYQMMNLKENTVFPKTNLAAVAA